MQTDATYQLSVMAWCLANPLDFELLRDRLKDYEFGDPRAAKIWPVLLAAYEVDFEWPTGAEAAHRIDTEFFGDPTADILVSYTHEVYATTTTGLTGEELRHWVATQELTHTATALRDICSEGVRGKEDAIIEAKGLKQISDTGAIGAMVDEVLAAHPAIVAEFRAGKQKAFNSLVGQVMKVAKGKANPSQVNELLKQRLEQ